MHDNETNVASSVIKTVDAIRHPIGNKNIYKRKVTHT